MAHDEMQQILDELNDLLDAERTALLDGRLDDVGRLHDRKARLVEALSDAEANSSSVPGPLRDKIVRNQDLLESASQGIRSVARRLAAIRRVRESLDTYDSRGRLKSVDLQPGTTLEKRA